MKLPRFLSTVLVLGCALLALAPFARAQQLKIVALTADRVDKLGKFVQTVNADAASKAAMEEIGKDETVTSAMMSGGSINDTVNTKYPKAAALYKAAGLTPDEFMQTIIAVSLAETGVTDGTTDPAVAKANVDFYNANKDKIEKIMSAMN